MQDLHYDIDPQGDTILVVRYPNTKQPVWEPTDQVSKLKQKNTIRRRKLFDLDFISDTEDGRSDDENADEPTPEPIAPITESNVPNDSGEAHRDNCKRVEVHFRLCSRHLALASPIFKTMLNGFWKESTPSSDQSNGSAKPLLPLQNDSNCQVRYELAATEWDAKDFLLLMNIVHCRSLQVPYSIDLETLGRISVLVDYYQCQEVTQFFAGLWIGKLSGSLPTTYGRDCVTWMFVSWVFSHSEIFDKMTQSAIRTCDGGLGTINLPFPPMLLSTATPHQRRHHQDLSKLMCFAAVMEQKRDHFIDEIFNVLGKLCKDIRGGGRGCNFECRSMLLGSLLTEMDKNELYGPCSAERAKFAALSLKSGTWHAHRPYYSGYHSPHSCTLNALLKPSIERLWDGLDGLKLDDHNGQNKKSADEHSST
ncbi:hypothetical protein E4U09_004774 [Claviceps aff. purpurea]|uniref:BTB domain-containing protein n=1 Tax=Claviceps aff. purpurea TaxID=1967640 RepID=A0A9P7QCR0_9HYPO|nr:hypothetical protein E4U09_004774 [Claviceps aff. purpurea]